MGFIVGLPGETKEDLEKTYQWCIDNDMQSWVFFGLGLNLTYDGETKSRFELEADKYGYIFSSDTTWANGPWNETNVNEYAKDLNKKSLEFQKPGGFNVSRFVNLGYDYDYIMNNNLGKAWDPFENAVIKGKMFVQRYVDFQKKLNK